MLVSNDKPGGGSQIKEALEGKDSAAVATAMKQAVMMILNGEQIPGLFITIVRYVLPSEDHTVQKLGLLYLVCPRNTSSIPGIDIQFLSNKSSVPFHFLCRRPLRRRTAQGNFSQKW